jgi:hypothetical protein
MCSPTRWQRLRAVDHGPSLSICWCGETSPGDGLEMTYKPEILVFINDAGNWRARTPAAHDVVVLTGHIKVRWRLIYS